MVFGLNFGVPPNLKSWCFVKDILQKSIKLLFRGKSDLEGVLDLHFETKIEKKSVPRPPESL